MDTIKRWIARILRTGQCRGLPRSIAAGGEDPIVAFVDGELRNREAIATVLAHLERCQPCAEKLRVILVLRGAPTGGTSTFTPTVLQGMRDRANQVM